MKYFTKIYAYIVQNNRGNINPYHSNAHLFHVYRTCMILFDEYKDEYNLSEKDRLELGIAALFHDYNHSGGKLKDDANIELAIEGLNLFLDNNSDIEIDRQNIIDIIRATEFPHKEMDLNFLQKIIRDADMSGGISKYWLSVVIDLASELNMDLQTFIPIQIKFLDTVEFNTFFCQELWRLKKDMIKKKLLKIMKDGRT